MRLSSFFAAIALCSTLSLASVSPRQSGRLTPVETRGNAFFAGDTRFYIRGVAYQPGGAADAADPLLDIPGLRRDIRRFTELGINTIRVYTIDNSQSHDEAMRMLDDAGIYLALDVNTPRYSLNRENAAAVHASYNDVYLQSVFATVDSFSRYNNLLLFFSANEVINARNNTNTAPYIKAVTRDIKRYISRRNYRRIPVGYSSADVAENIQNQAEYFNCGADDERSDFFAFNDYSWCDPSSFTQSGWDQKVRTYQSYSVPLFLSEFGCITNTRTWGEIASLYSTNMTGVYSGGLVYEYTVEPNGFGLVEVGSSGDIVPNADFQRLAEAYSNTPNPQGNGGFRPTGSASQCPSQSEEWEVASTNLPVVPQPAVRLMNNGAGTGPGLQGTGSQWMGTPSADDAPSGSGSAGSSPTGSAGGSGGQSTAATDATSVTGTALVVLLSTLLAAGMLI